MDDAFDLVIDYKSLIPVYEQIKQEFKQRILTGAMTAGDRAPSIRGLSGKLRVNQNTVLKAYYQLETEGFIYSKPGLGYFVKERSGEASREKGELFQYATTIYLDKITSLGFSIKDALEELKKR